jgi:hypothetical protein
MGNAGEGDLERDRRVSEAFRRAVAREHEAIAAHEHAADMHEATAARLEAAAETESDPDVAVLRRGGRRLSVRGRMPPGRARRLLVSDCATRELPERPP